MKIHHAAAVSTLKREQTFDDTDDLMRISLLNYYAPLPPKIPIVQHRFYLFYIQVGQSVWHLSDM